MLQKYCQTVHRVVEIFANYISDQRSISKIHRGLKLTHRYHKNNHSDNMNKTVYKDIKMANKPTKTTPGETRIKTTVIYHFIPISMATTKNTTQQKIVSAGKAVEKLESLLTVSGMVKRCSHYGK